MKTGKTGNLVDGEQAVLKLAADRNGWAVIDDLRARKQAEKMQINYAGTLTILRKALEKDLINRTQLKRIVEDLRDKDQFRMTKDLRDWLLR